MANIKFWLGMAHRVGLKRNDKLMVGNIDNGKAEYIDIAEILSALDSDDLPEGEANLFLTPTLKQKLIDLSAANYTLEQLQGYFYPKTGNPDGFLTSSSSLASAKLTGIIAASLIPGLSADKITAGILAAARIPNLDASKINAGTFHIDRIPQIPASKLEDFALTLSDYILKTAIGAANGVTPLNANSEVPTGHIPGLDAAKIVSGILAEERIPDIYIKLADIVDNLLSTDPSKVASANQVRVLNEKIDGLAGAKFKGEYPTFAALVLEYPEGPDQEWHNNLGGWNADVDLGENEDVAHYIFDLSDLKWVRQLGTADAETGITIEQKYEARPDTNKFQDAHKAKVESLPASVESTGGAQTKADAAQTSAEQYADLGDADLQLQINDNDDDIADHELRIGDLEAAIVKEKKEFAISDETTALVADAAVPVFSYRFLEAFTGMSFILAQVIGAPTGSKLELDVHKNGVSIFNTTLTIDIGEFISSNAAVPAVLTTATIDWVVGDLMEVFVLDPGTNDAAFGCKMLIKNY